MARPLQLNLFTQAILTGSLLETLPPASPPKAAFLPPMEPAGNYRLTGDRPLAKTWSERATDNIAAIRLAQQIETERRVPTLAEQERLILFTGFGASKLATSLFPVGNAPYRDGWADLGSKLRQTVPSHEWSTLTRTTQYAHYTPEFMVRALWRGVQHLGFTGGSILEPGCGTGLFLALAPAAIAERSRFTGVEFDHTTARIARLLHPRELIVRADFTDPGLDVGGDFDLAIGNPPFSDRSVAMFDGGKLALHEYFIWRALSRLRPGGIGAFIVSHYLMDKQASFAREQIAQLGELTAAIRMPATSMRWAAGTDVVVDVLFFRRHASDDHAPPSWLDTAELDAAFGARTVQVNRYWSEHPEMVLGLHGIASSQYGPAYTCTKTGTTSVPVLLAQAIARFDQPRAEAPAAATPAIEPDPPTAPEPAEPPPAPPQAPPIPPPEIRIDVRSIAEGGTLREGSFALNDAGMLCQVRGAILRPVAIRQGRSGPGMPAKRAAIICSMIGIRDATREVLRAQEADQPWDEPLDRLQLTYDRFVAKHGPVNLTKRMIRNVTRVVAYVDEDTGETIQRTITGESVSYRRPNLEAFGEDPDVWLVAAIEDYDLATEEASPGPIFTRRVVLPVSPPKIDGPTDALAVVLNEQGKVAIDRIAELLGMTEPQAIEALGDRIYLDPETGAWELADAYLSGLVRSKLAVAEACAVTEPKYERNIEALRRVQPRDLKPSDITARLGAPYIEPALVAQFSHEVIGVSTKITHNVDLAIWEVDKYPYKGGTTVWGTHRRHAGLLLEDALNSRMPKIYDTVFIGGTKYTELNVKETEAAKEKLGKLKRAFAQWIWLDADRASDLVHLYNARYNNLIARKYDGSHLILPGASDIISFRPHQLDGIWQCIASGTTFLAHVVGSGKTYAGIAAIMEQRRLGLVRKAMVVVPSHTLGQWAREWMLLYPTARILVADEENFQKARRMEFLARAATGDWDAIIITHDAFKRIPAPAGFEATLLQEQVEQYAEALGRVQQDDRVSRKRLENLTEKAEARLRSLRSAKDDLVTIAEIGIDQMFVDEFQAFRKLSFATNMSGLRGITADGSQRSWDMFVKTRYIDRINPGRALIAASGTPVVNTMGELYTLLRFVDPAAIEQRGVHQFDAFAAAFCDVSSTIELQPNGKYKPITRFAVFTNIPEMTVMFRMRASVVRNDYIRAFMDLPDVEGGKRQIITAEPTQAFKRYQAVLDARIKAIEARRGPPKKGDDIILTVIGDGRHAAIDLRFVLPHFANEEDNKLNKLIDNAFTIYKERTGDTFINRRTGHPYPIAGCAQMIFSDLGTLAVENSRGFSAYRWIKERLIELGVPESEIAIMQQFKRTDDKIRLFNQVNAGVVKFLIGSSLTMGTGVNAQLRLRAMHHLDVPWCPGDLEQREGRIIRQGNQYQTVQIFAYATETSMDAPMWQTLERKQRFIEQALTGDSSVRTMEDDPEASLAKQFALAKAIASGDPRLMQQAALMEVVARLHRLADAHRDEQYTIRSEVEYARRAIIASQHLIPLIESDITQRQTLPPDKFSMTVGKQTFTERKAGAAAIAAELRRRWIDQNEAVEQIATYLGFPIIAAGGTSKFDKEERYDLAVQVQLTGRTKDVLWGAETMPHVLMQRIEAIIMPLDEALAYERTRLAAAQRKLAMFEPRLGERFQWERELATKTAELEAIEIDLAAGTPPPEK